MILDMGYDGSTFSVEREFNKIKNSNYKNVFITDVDNIENH